MSFFKQFPTKDVKVENLITNATTGNITLDIQNKKITDIFRHVDVTTLAASSYTGYTFYDIQDGERPDVISYKLYGTSDHYWTIFIINDFLQSGSNEFFKSNEQFDKGIELEYGHLSSIVFIPEVTQTSIINAEGTTLYGNSNRENLGGIDFTPPWLRLRALQFGNINRGLAKIIKYDAEKCQLIIEFTGAEADKAAFFANTSYGFDLSLGTDAEKTAWLASLNKAQLEKNPTPRIDGSTPETLTTLTVAEAIASAGSGAFSILPSIPNLVSFPVTAGPTTVLFPYLLETSATNSSSSSRAFPDMKNAPFAYIAQTAVDGETALGDQIQAYQAIGEGLGGYSSTISYLEHERDHNEKNRRLVVIKPEYIDLFVEEYKTLIQS
jgi:hypothetical protein